MYCTIHIELYDFILHRRKVSDKVYMTLDNYAVHPLNVNAALHWPREYQLDLLIYTIQCNCKDTKLVLLHPIAKVTALPWETAFRHFDKWTKVQDTVGVPRSCGWTHGQGGAPNVPSAWNQRLSGFVFHVYWACVQKLIVSIYWGVARKSVLWKHLDYAHGSTVRNRRWTCRRNAEESYQSEGSTHFDAEICRPQGPRLGMSPAEQRPYINRNCLFVLKWPCRGISHLWIWHGEVYIHNNVD